MNTENPSPQSASPDPTPSNPTPTAGFSTSRPTESSRAKTEEIRARVRESLNRTGDFAQSKGGRPPNIEGRVSELERLTGKKVILRGPDDKPEAIDVGNMTVTPEQYADLQLESEDSLAQGFQSLSDLWADWIGKDTIRTKPAQAKTLGKIWNLSLTKMMAKVWLKWSTIMVAGFITVFWFVPRFLETLKFLIARRKKTPTLGNEKR